MILCVRIIWICLLMSDYVYITSIIVCACIYLIYIVQMLNDEAETTICYKSPLHTAHWVHSHDYGTAIMESHMHSDGAYHMRLCCSRIDVINATQWPMTTVACSFFSRLVYIWSSFIRTHFVSLCVYSRCVHLYNIWEFSYHACIY